MLRLYSAQPGVCADEVAMLEVRELAARCGERTSSKEPRRYGLRAIHVGSGGDDLTIDGIGAWREAWRTTGNDALQLAHPRYDDQRQRFDIYEIGPPDSPVRVAAGEVSNGVRGSTSPPERR